MKYLNLFALLFLVVACNPAKDDPTAAFDPEDVSLCKLYSAPTGLQYALSTITVVKNSAIPSVVPTYNSGLPVSFRTTPQLPNGISINPVNGEILGVPTLPQATRSYELIAANDCGTSVFNLTIQVKEIPPSSISYSNASYSINIGDNFPVISPTVAGVADLFSVNPPLPAGLLFDELSGVISGKPFSSQISNSYTITVSNSGGNKSTVINIEVKGKAPTSLSYQYTTSTYKAGEDILNNYPLYSGDAATNFSIAPTLPEGLSLNSQTGIIFGNPELPINNQQYTITAGNTWGETTTIISLSVLNNINDVATGVEHTCAIKNRKVYCQGRNDKFQLGYATTTLCSDIIADEHACSRAMLPVSKNNETLKAKKIATALDSTCVLGIDSKVYCWGNNNKGQTGSGSNSPTITEPSVVIFNNNELTNIRSLKAGYNHFCAVNNNSELYCWGDNSDFQLNNSVLLYSNSAMLVESNFTDFALGSNHTCIIKNSLPYCVGSNQYYQLAIGNTQNSASFTLALKADGSFSSATSLWAGSDFSIFKENDLFFASGLNSQGELGLAESNFYSTAVPILTNYNPSLIVTGGAPSDLELTNPGGPSLCFIQNGLGFCQGKNDNNFANNTGIGAAHAVPLEILADISTPFVNIEKISQGYSNHRCLARNGDLFCFGQNYMGQVAADPSVVKDLPVLVIFP